MDQFPSPQNCEKNFQIAWGSCDQGSWAPGNSHQKVGTVQPWYCSEVSRHFHRDVGLPLVAYRTRLRLIRFIQLVEGGDRNFLAAATDAGFGSYSQCHRAFQQAFGCTPRVFFGTSLCAEMKARFAPDSADDD